MKVLNSVYPDEQQIKGFLEPAPEGPIAMVNLLKFKKKAEYEDGRETSLSGREAYDIYEQGMRKLLAEIGGSIDFVGEVERLMLGQVEELWDTVAIAVWPSRSAMFELMQSEALQAISVHRTAGLAGQLNIETRDVSGKAEQA